MKRYHVSYHVTGYASAFVDADSEEEADRQGVDLIDWSAFEPSEIEAEEIVAEEEA